MTNETFSPEERERVLFPRFNLQQALENRGISNENLEEFANDPTLQMLVRENWVQEKDPSDFQKLAEIRKNTIFEAEKDSPTDLELMYLEYQLFARRKIVNSNIRAEALSEYFSIFHDVGPVLKERRILHYRKIIAPNF